MQAPQHQAAKVAHQNEPVLGPITEGVLQPMLHERDCHFSDIDTNPEPTEFLSRSFCDAAPTEGIITTKSLLLLTKMIHFE